MLSPVGLEVRRNLGSEGGIWGTNDEGKKVQARKHPERTLKTLEIVLALMFIPPHEVAVSKVCKEDYTQEKGVEVRLLSPVRV